MNKLSILVLSLILLGTSPYSPRNAEGSSAYFSYSGLYKKTAPGVVLIVAGDGGNKVSVGSGSIISKNGWVLTNAHVVLKSLETQTPQRRIEIHLKPKNLVGNLDKDLNHPFVAKLFAFDPIFDVALLKFNPPPEGITVISFSDSKGVSIGDSVVIIGHGGGFSGLWAIHGGIISSRRLNHRKIRGRHIFQTDAPFNPGNSGGPLLDSSGGLIGVNTSRAEQSGSGARIQNIGYSLQSNVAREWVKKQGVQVNLLVRPKSAPKLPDAPHSIRKSDGPPKGMPDGQKQAKTPHNDPKINTTPPSTKAPHPRQNKPKPGPIRVHPRSEPKSVVPTPRPAQAGSIPSKNPFDFKALKKWAAERIKKSLRERSQSIFDELEGLKKEKSQGLFDELKKLERQK